MGYLEDGKRPLYGLWQLPELAEDETIYIVEGEKCADLLMSLGLVAITSPGGAQSAGKADWTPLFRFNEIVILLDNDESGEQYCTAVVNEFQGHQPNRLIQTARFSFLEEKGDVVNLIQSKLSGWDGYEPILQDECKKLREYLLEKIESIVVANEIARIAEIAGTHSENNFPENMVPYPVNAMGTALAGAAWALHDITKAPMAMCAQGVLAAANLVTQGLVNVRVGGRTFPISECFLTIGVSGERKSEIDRVALMPIRQYESELWKRRQENLAKYEEDLLVFEKQRKKRVNARTSGTNLSTNATGDLDKPEMPRGSSILISDVTMEGVHRYLEYGYPSIGVFNDEGGILINGYAMKDENCVKSMAAMCGMWGGASVKIVRAGSGELVIMDKRFSFHLMIQPAVANTLLSNEMATKQGFLGRCLIAYPKSTIGTRMYEDVDICADSRITQFQERLASLLRSDLPLVEGFNNRLEPREISPTQEALLEYIKYHDRVELQLDIDRDGLLTPIPEFACKAAEHALRVAAMLEVFENPKAQEISIDSMLAGIELIEYYTSETLRLKLSGLENRNLRLRDSLLVWLKKKHPNNPFTVSDIQQYCKPKIRDLGADRIRNLLLELKDVNEVANEGDQWTLIK